MKKFFENKENLWGLMVLIGLLALGLIVAGWRYWQENKPIDIGHPQKGDFVKVGQMSVPRYNHQAVLLDDGTVLLFGGMTLRKDYEGGSYTADIYDPKTKKFTPVGNMLEHRKDFAFTKLKNGKVLITGGRVGNKTVKSAEIYNPETRAGRSGNA